MKGDVLLVHLRGIACKEEGPRLDILVSARVHACERQTTCHLAEVPPHRGILELVNQSGRAEGSLEVNVVNFGETPLLAVAGEPRMVQAVDALLPKRDHGHSTEEHMLIATITRCIAPCSKLKIRLWFDGTILPWKVVFRFLSFSAEQNLPNYSRLCGVA